MAAALRFKIGMDLTLSRGVGSQTDGVLGDAWQKIADKISEN
jgi:hypothetical protein